ncbi:MAG: GNAT family N-acetyltransferase [Actinomycetota bacterium]|nr:GNAT family N-acetyltransferase [Actinomycetota bacterium]
MDSPSFRRATPDDVERIAEIHVAAWRAAYRGLIDDAALDDRTVAKRIAQWREVVEGDAFPAHAVYVAEVDREIKGFSQVGPSDDPDASVEPTFHVYALYLDPAERGRGLGTALLDHVLREAASSGYTLTTLYVLIENDGARRFYERHGWEAEPDIVTECLGDGTKAPQVRYRKRLQAQSAATP